MSKPIKIRDDQYKRLQELQGPRETYADVLERLLKVFDTVSDVRDTLGPHHYLSQRPKEGVEHE